MNALNPVSQSRQQMHTQIMDIGPEQAMRWLEANTRNRSLDQNHVNRLSEEMKAGRWRLTHEGIAFDSNSVLQDGQHRLWAITMSGCTVPMSVTFNAPADSIECVGGGKPRLACERMSLSGRFDGTVGKNLLAALRAMVRGLNPDRKISFSREMDLLAEHKPAVDFAVGHLTTSRVKGVGSSVTRAVIARAWYSVDQEKLRRFCEVLRTGLASNPVEGTIILLRDYLATTDRSDTLANAREHYGKVERTLLAFLSGKPLSVIRPCTTEMFSLPGEKERAA